MKAKTINAIISKKFSNFLGSIEDETVKDLVKKNTIVTGGCIASMLLNEKVNDFDLYFTNKATCSAVANHYVELFKANPPPRFKNGVEVPIRVDDEGERVKIVIKSAGIASEDGDEGYQYFEGIEDPEAMDATDYVDAAMEIADADEDKPDYRPVFLSGNAITLSNGVQLILRFYGEADEIHKNYDFVHCTNYWTSKDHKLTLRPDALEALLTKELRYVGSKYPICSAIRIRKFVKRGFTINAGQVLKMAMQISELDLKQVEVLEDQLIGVDVAYFQEVIDKLKARDKSQVDSAYLLEIIDRMF